MCRAFLFLRSFITTEKSIIFYLIVLGGESASAPQGEVVSSSSNPVLNSPGVGAVEPGANPPLQPPTSQSIPGASTS